MLGPVSIWTGQPAPTQITRDWRDWVGFAARMALGIGLGLAGLLKVGSLAANVEQVKLYQLPIPDWAATIIGYSQPFLEIVVGLLLIAGLFTRISGALGALAMAAFIAGISWAWAKGLNIDCGCFSAGGELDPGEQHKYLQDILRDLGWLACGLWLTIRPRSVLAVDNWLLRPIAQFDYDELDTEPEDAALASPTTN